MMKYKHNGSRSISHSDTIGIGKAIAIRVIEEFGEKYISTRFLDSGSTSSAFKVSSDRADYILKVSTPQCGKTASYESDFCLRSSIWNEDLPLAKPIATNTSLEIDIKAIWALDEFQTGSNPLRGKISTAVSYRLGELLRVIHNIPVSGHGRLENTRLKLRGVADTPETGLLTRFESPWPFSPKPLAHHPSVQEQPRLLEKLKPLESVLLDFIHDGSPTLVHSDLHEGQLLESNGKLTTLLDFNEAMVGRREWDLGSYLYFHGAQCFTDLLDGYSPNGDERSEIEDKATYASLLIALHHGNRGVILNRPHRIKASIHFLERVLS